MRDREVLPVVGEIEHGLEVQVLLRVVEDLGEDEVRVEDAVGIGLHGGNLALPVPLRELRRIAVIVVDMAAHDVQHDEIVLRRVDGLEIVQQRLVVFVGEVVGVVRPFRVIGRLGDERDGAVILAVAPLVAEPVGRIARLFRDVEDGGRVEEFFVVVLALLRERALQHGHGLRPAGVSVREDVERGILQLAVEPGRVLEREVRRERVHVVARG